MAHLLIVNPSKKPSLRKRKGVKRMAKKRRSAAQKAATARMLAANRARRSGKKRTVRAKSTRRRRRSSTLQSVKRHGRPASARAFHAAGYSRNPARRKLRRYRRNPIGGALNLGNIVTGTLMPAATAATGAIALDVAFGYLPLPDMLKTGPMRHVVKGAGAIALGVVAGMVVKRETAKQFAAGAMTVVMYNAMKEVLARFAPNVAMGAYLSENGDDGVGAYLSDAYTDATSESTINGAYDLGQTYDLNGAYDMSEVVDF